MQVTYGELKFLDWYYIPGDPFAYQKLLHQGEETADEAAQVVIRK